MTNPEGKLNFTLQWQEDGVSARVESTRPVQACHVFQQCTVADTLKRLPLLFNICGQAQSVAAVRAIESISENYASDSVEKQRDLLVAFESIREHLWRILLDWPVLAGEQPLTGKLSPWHQQLLALQNRINPNGELTQQPGQKAVAADFSSLNIPWQGLSTEIGEMLKGDSGDIPLSTPECLLEPLRQQSWSALGGLYLDTLPEMPARELAEAFESIHDFVALPEWAGKVFETGPYARQLNHPRLIQARELYGHGVYTRLTARIVEVSQLLDWISQSFQDNTMADLQRGEQGIAQVEAVRGRLVHAVELKGDRISRYRILAPTEWNFHPQGIAMQMLSSLDDPEQIEKQAAWVIQAIDPCVGYDITVIDET